MSEASERLCTRGRVSVSFPVLGCRECECVFISKHRGGPADKERGLGSRSGYPGQDATWQVGGPCSTEWGLLNVECLWDKCVCVHLRSMRCRPFFVSNEGHVVQALFGHEQL